MSDVKIEHKVGMTRTEAAKWLADVAKELSGDGTVAFRLAESTVELKVSENVRFEAEVEVDGDRVELELELSWSNARKPPTSAAKNGSAGA
ncbi:amphi-Trp domain-containing protein [Blastococcus sp. CT_GayMR20]|uniref:amphi-Trp domain-containing protein n=1 Tax=Blastococcus sp. CT_GayMR20 TaxID=2559609 RepID=UPI0010748DA3|nr:amphi-Trp domain-containing protein [Blastococcus sp. CT_GayMR20]TFV92963.1 amphi-Trp domain-containing protein [Blastococcus sp. CT_GayMR20]